MSKTFICLLIVCWTHRNFSVVVFEEHACETFVSRKNHRRVSLASSSRNIKNRCVDCDGAVWAKAAIKIRWFQPTERVRSPFVSQASIHAHSQFPPFLFEAQHVSPLVFITDGNLRSKKNNIPNMFYYAEIDLTKRREEEAFVFLSIIGAVWTLCKILFMYLSKRTFSDMSYAHHIMSNAYLYV